MRRRSTVLAALAAAVVLTGAGATHAAAVTGPDVSSWQHPGGSLINWGAVKAAGQSFAMVKATEGLDYVNPFFVPDVLAMRASGVATGTYHYADVTLPAAPQAAFFSAMTFGQHGPMDLPPVIDFEDAKGQSPAQLKSWLHQYLDAVQSLTGKTPIIYTYQSFWRNQMANTTDFANYPLWIADYNGQNQPGALPGGWKNWTFWQYTDSGHLPGVQGNVDLNKYNTSLGSFADYINSPGVTSPQSDATTTTTSPDQSTPDQNAAPQPQAAPAEQQAPSQGQDDDGQSTLTPEDIAKIESLATTLLNTLSNYS
ncbi:glycoside hydrolase [Rhodococcus sp. D2-41]|nr:glycoside hydrolase [Rhodococcus sp. D2-41]